MQRSKTATPEKPQFETIVETVIEQVKSGAVTLPMEDKLTVGELIRAGAFESAANMRGIEIEAIAHMATAKIHGKDSKGAYEEWTVKDANTATPRQQIEKTLQGLDHGHSYRGLIQGEQSKKQYIAELDRTAQQFVEANYPDRPR